MKKYFALIMLPLCLASCESKSLSSDAYISVSKWGDYDIQLTDGIAYEYMTFNNGIARVIEMQENKDTHKYEKYYVVCAYYKADGGLLFIQDGGMSPWYEIYQGKTEKESGENSNYFKKLDKLNYGYKLWGEIGKGWIKKIEESSSNYNESLYVTLKCAKKSGITIINRTYDSDSGEWVYKKY